MSAGSEKTAAVNFLLGWYELHGRTFPWRLKGGDQYILLIAEVLLKKTGALSVIPVFNEITRRYPSPDSLSKARKSTLTRLLLPIGLNDQRATQLQYLGKALKEQEMRLLTSDQLLELPGVGPYTAAIVAAISIGERKVGIDTNVSRLLSRIFGVIGSRCEERKSPEFWAVGEQLAKVAGDKVAELNWALLDFGAAICRRRNPQCISCPLEFICLFYQRFSSFICEDHPSA